MPAERTDTLNLEAYYYSFDATGCEPIDRILAAVARAGKAYHFTGDWTDPDFDGQTPIAKIQAAAQEAAQALAAARREGREEMRERAEKADAKVREWESWWLMAYNRATEMGGHPDHGVWAYQISAKVFVARPDRIRALPVEQE